MIPMTADRIAEDWAKDQLVKPEVATMIRYGK
jgi:hypothetical protein